MRVFLLVTSRLAPLALGFGRLLVIAFAACQGQGAGPPPLKHDDAAKVAIVADAALPDAASESDAHPKDPEEPPDPNKVITELGAIPAWEAVVDRADLLARRGQHGVVYGRVGPAIMVLGPTPEANDAGVHPDAGMVKSPYVWLVDDTEGNGCLGIRIVLGDKAKEGDRIAAGGAWAVDEERRWYWKSDAIQPLPPAPPSTLKEPPPPAPTHTPIEGYFPQGGRMISFARENDAVIFQLVGAPPVNDGDGWPVADELGNPVFALLMLPGERASYGGLDMRAADERWTLKRGQTYWVRIGAVHKHGPDKPVTLFARTPPVWVR